MTLLAAVLTVHALQAPLGDPVMPAFLRCQPTQDATTWFAGVHAELGEPPLRSSPREQSIYRVTVAPARGRPRSVRLTLAEGAATIEARWIASEGRGADRRVRRASMKLTDAQADEFRTLFASLGFGATCTDEVLSETERDGEEWVLEAAQGGGYHAVTRWCPTTYEPRRRGLTRFVAMCEWLLRAGEVARHQGNGPRRP